MSWKNALLIKKERITHSLNPLTTNVPNHVETSQLIGIANHLAGFYIMGNIGC